MKCRRRYVVFEVESDLNISGAAAAICKELRADLGSIRLIAYDAESGRGILFCCHYLLDDLRKKIAESRFPIKILGVSGTIRAAKRKFGLS